MGAITIRATAVSVTLEVNAEGLSYEEIRLWMRSANSFAFSADEIENVEIVVKDIGISRSLEIVVVAGGEAYDTTFPNADGDLKRALVEASLDTLSGAGEAFYHQDNGKVAGLLLGLVCIGGGLYCWNVIQSVTIVGDRAASTLRIRRSRRLLGRAERQSIPLDEITRVRVEAHTLDTGKLRTTSYQVEIALCEGEPVPVAYGPMFTEASAEELRSLLEGWLSERAG